MSRLLITLLLALSLPVMAAPAAGEDDLGRMITERGLLGRLEQVGVTVKDRAADLVVDAMGFLGVPYKRGGVSEDTGFDCSGFVRAVYEQAVGMVLPRNIDPGDLAPGDLVFFNTMQQAFSHVGIYIGNGKFVHSPKAGDRIKLDHLSSSYWKPRFDGARRVAHPAAGPLAEAPRPIP